jgi:alpha-galactosidase
LSRQQIQRWTTQLVAPEYLGAHVSAPTSHQTGRTLTLAFRAATALFCGFGIEWDLTSAGEEDLDELARWVQLHKRHRRLLHTGRVVRPESSDPAVLLHGVVSRDRRSALLAHVQVDESEHNRGVAVRVPGLRADERYEARWEGPVDLAAVSAGSPMDPEGPTGGIPLSGALLATVGMWLPRRRPETVTLVSLTAPDS